MVRAAFGAINVEGSKLLCEHLTELLYNEKSV